MNIEEQRKAFEKEWAVKYGMDVSWNPKINEYLFAITHTCFSVWLAAQNQEGFVLVNKRDLAKVLNCVTDDWLIDTNSMDEFNKIELLVADEVKSMIQESQK